MLSLKDIQTAFLAVGLALVFSSCDPDDDNTCCDPTNPECTNYDPCYGKIETTAFFTISQALSNFGENASVFIEDDVVTGGTLKFSAIPQEGATYTWILGIDTTIGGSEITTTLGNLPNGSYPNTLIVTKTPDTLCFPLDDGHATHARSFNKILGCEAAIWGRYRGVFSSQPNDSTEIEFALSSNHLEIQPLPCPSSNIQGIFFVNANMIGDTLMMNIDGSANSILSFAAYGSIDKPEGKATIDSSSNLVLAEYTIWDTSYTFTGRKL
ncbi:hypothetical protein G3O08_19315 [Cryomorpha ignava]|uniref:Lipoprotein n=1 Tax=Cryomorpha ignava TaxID=101383 RepID=A0A7K3WVF3_9FLAO|nr:hypothetical protein [Cryomorpha ignava]NEN25647.1 hypothetical protein [Cryomorpha ignava]